MLLLLFYVGGERYAIDSSQILEVIPRVNLRKVYHVHDYLSGIFNYRGAIVPVIDLSYLIKGASSNFSFSTRIIIVSYLTANNTQNYLGLMAEKITETLNISEENLVNYAHNQDINSYFGQIIMADYGIIQLINIESLVANSQAINFLPSSFLVDDDTK